jgi:RNA polymerase sigma factor for flagellar operon FliA
MRPTTDEPSAYRITPAELGLLTQVVRDVARARRLSCDAAAEFAQTVHVKLLERKYDVFSRFRGTSSLRTYLTTVVTRLLRNSELGKWRSSAAARRGGPHAIELERLIARDGFTINEAVEIVRAGHPDPPQDLRTIAEQLPARRRRLMIGDDALANLPGPAFSDPVAEDDRRRADAIARRRLAQALDELPPEDRLLLRLRYASAHSIVSIGRKLQADPKILYRRLERTLRRLRRNICRSNDVTHAPFFQREENGVSGAGVQTDRTTSR